MGNLNKYKRSNINIFEKNTNEEIKGLEKKSRRKGRGTPLTEKFTMNFTKEEAQKLYDINEETGIPISTLLRKKLKESGIFE